MAQTTFSVRMDDNLKKQFELLCSDFGMNMSTAFTIFAKAVVRERKIPFKIAAEPEDITKDWSQEYWNGVHLKIAESELQFENGATVDAFESLEYARQKYGL